MCNGILQRCDSARCAGWVLMAVLAFCTTALHANEILTKREEGLVYDQAIHILGGNANVVSKWMGDIRFAIIGEATEDSTALAQTTFSAIAELTGLSLQPVTHAFMTPSAYLEAVEQSSTFELAACSIEDSSLCANFVVMFTDADTMLAMTKAIPLRLVYHRSLANNQKIPCFFAPLQLRRMEIRQAFVYVRQDLSQAMVRTCLQEEIYQSFGLFNDFSGSEFFSFNNVVEPKFITRYDKALLRSVYDERIKPGGLASHGSVDGKTRY